MADMQFPSTPIFIILLKKPKENWRELAYEAEKNHAKPAPRLSSVK